MNPVMRYLAIGDMQAPFAQVLDVLRANHALTAQDRLAADVHLVTVGDYFDFGTENLADVAAQGVAILRWLADHSPEQCTILLGNHDTARVVEFAHVPSDSLFQAAAQRARTVRTLSDPIARGAATAQFASDFPWAPPPNYLARDFAAFTTPQRELLANLLLRRRVRLAIAAQLVDGREVLVNHAAVTLREMGLLGLDAKSSPHAIAAALDTHLYNAAEACGAAWAAGRMHALSLAPLQIAATPAAESGGLLFHRPANSQRPDADVDWELCPASPRRFSPRNLPACHQVIGHTTHRKMLELIGDWVPPASHDARAGRIRTLRTSPAEIRYATQLLPPSAGAVDLIMIDGELRITPPKDYELLELSGVIGL